MMRVGLVGAGYWGTNLCRVLSQSPQIRLNWVCDSDQASLDRAVRVASVAKVTTRFGDLLLDDSEVDAVVLATPVDSHFELALAALEHGKHVLVEKPMTRSAVQAERLCRTADAKGLVLMVGHTFLYNGAVRYIKRLIDGGDLGDIRYILCQRLNLGIVRQDVDALWNLAPHDISMLNYWTGKLPTRFEAVGHAFLQSGIADVVFAHLTYKGGVAGHVHVSWLDPGKVRRATIVGSKKMLVYDDVSSDSRIAIFDKGIDKHNLGANLGAVESYAEHRLRIRAGDTVLPRVDFPEPLSEEIREFATAVEEGRRPLTDGQNGLEVVRILERLTAAMDLRETP